MKKFTTSLITLILLLALTPFLQSCLDDDDKVGYYSLIATYRLTQSNDPYFVSDDDDRLYPQNGSYDDLKDGQRVYVYFDSPEELKESSRGDEYTIRVLSMQKVLTKNVFTMTEETADSIGDNRINITHGWFGDGYLNLLFQFYGTQNPSQLHMVNLVHNGIEGAEIEDEEGYIYLEFRHNAYDDSPAERLNGIAAFKGTFTEDENLKGVKIRYKSTYDGVKYIKIDFPKAQTGSSDTLFSTTSSSLSTISPTQ